MTPEEFERAMIQAETFRIQADSLVVKSYFEGYMFGLQRNAHGEAFVPDFEHAFFLSLFGDDDRIQRAKGEGYRDGLRTGELKSSVGFTKWPSPCPPKNRLDSHDIPKD
jgi:hypothetical protein